MGLLYETLPGYCRCGYTVMRACLVWLLNFLNNSHWQLRMGTRLMRGRGTLISPAHKQSLASPTSGWMLFLHTCHMMDWILPLLLLLLLFVFLGNVHYFAVIIKGHTETDDSSFIFSLWNAVRCSMLFSNFAKTFSVHRCYVVKIICYFIIIKKINEKILVVMSIIFLRLDAH